MAGRSRKATDLCRRWRHPARGGGSLTKLLLTLGGPGRIRTYEAVRQQIYSLSQLTALVPTQDKF